MIIRKCTPEDIIYILQHPWEVTRQEMENFGFKDFTHEYLADKFLENNFGHNLVAIDDAGNPIWAFGVAIANYTDWTSWALYGENFPLYKKEAIEIYKEAVADWAAKQRALDGKFERVILVTAVDSPKVSRWCETIGFKKATDSGITKNYEANLGVYVREFY